MPSRRAPWRSPASQSIHALWRRTVHSRPAYPGRHSGGHGAERQTFEEIVAELPDLEPEDVRQALRHAAVGERDQA
jgi:hypothetical protein